MSSIERNLIKTELIQRREEGCDVGSLEDRITKALADGAPDAEFIALYDELSALPIMESFPYDEPSSLPEIQKARPAAVNELILEEGKEAIYDRIRGAWLGRAAGCALGKPVEGWPKERIDKYLTKANALPLDDYIPYDEKVTPKTLKLSTRGNIEFMDRDDDLDYPILGLLALESRGAKMTSKTIAGVWLHSMPFGLTYTAENVAYRNFILNVWPPESGTYRNPFREWIGAQIRADIFGYVSPANPEQAAELAYLDACISHDKNGVYGEMFVAAMIASAFVLKDAKDIILAGLAQIPDKSRLAEAVRNTLSWCEQNENWETTWQKVYEAYGHYHTVHTINNAALVVMGLYYGDRGFEEGIVTAVRSGWDTDCNGATVGSILGLKIGAQNLPNKWIDVLNDRLISAVRGENDNQISDLARRTLAVAEQIENYEEEKTPEPPSVWREGGVWELESGWGFQRVDFEKGHMEFISDGFNGSYPIISTSFQNPRLKFTVSIDKGGWETEIEFEGRLNGDSLEGAYNPMDTPVTGKRVTSD